MISEQTAIDTRTLPPVSAARVGFTATCFATLRKHVGIVASRALIKTSAVLRAFAGYGNPQYFQFERRGPVRQRLGPGVSRESDSFWAVSQW